MTRKNKKKQSKTPAGKVAAVSQSRTSAPVRPRTIAPSNRGMPRTSVRHSSRTHRRHGDVHIVHVTEPMVVLETSDDFVLYTIQLNPNVSTAFPVAAGLSRSYQKFRYTRMELQYAPLCPSTTAGSIAAAHVDDPSTTPPTDSLNLAAFDGGFDSSVTSAFRSRFAVGPEEDDDEWYLTSFESSISSLEKHFQGLIFVATEGGAATPVAAGIVWAHYTLELCGLRPETPTSVWGASSITTPADSSNEYFWWDSVVSMAGDLVTGENLMSILGAGTYDYDEMLPLLLSKVMSFSGLASIAAPEPLESGSQNPASTIAQLRIRRQHRAEIRQDIASGARPLLVGRCGMGYVVEVNGRALSRDEWCALEHEIVPRLGDENGENGRAIFDHVAHGDGSQCPHHVFLLPMAANDVTVGAAIRDRAGALVSTIEVVTQNLPAAGSVALTNNSLIASAYGEFAYLYASTPSGETRDMDLEVASQVQQERTNTPVIPALSREAGMWRAGYARQATCFHARARQRRVLHSWDLDHRERHVRRLDGRASRARRERWLAQHGPQGQAADFRRLTRTQRAVGLSSPLHAPTEQRVQRFELNAEYAQRQLNGVARGLQEHRERRARERRAASALAQLAGASASSTGRPTRSRPLSRDAGSGGFVEITKPETSGEQ